MNYIPSSYHWNDLRYFSFILHWALTGFSLKVYFLIHFGRLHIHYSHKNVFIITVFCYAVSSCDLYKNWIGKYCPLWPTDSWTPAWITCLNQWVVAPCKYEKGNLKMFTKPFLRLRDTLLHQRAFDEDPVLNHTQWLSVDSTHADYASTEYSTSNMTCMLNTMIFKHC